MLLFRVAVLAALLSSHALVGQFCQQGAKLVGSDAEGDISRGHSVAVSSDGNTAIVGGPHDNGSTGAAWVYTRSGGVWTQQGTKLVGTGAVGPAGQGSSVSLSADGNSAIVGGSADNEGTGAAWVYTRSEGIWTQRGTKLVGTGAVGTAYQGYSVSLSTDGNTAIVGGSGDNGGAGAAWVYTQSGGVWSQDGAKLVGTGALGAAQQGRAVSLSADGNTAIVGGFYDNGNAGAAWVFKRGGGVWAQQGTKLVGTGAVGPAFQGWSVSLSADGGTAIVGGPGNNGNAGAAWVFAQSGGVWTQQGNKLAGTGAVGTAFQGSSVSLSADGNTAITGGYSDNAYAGAAWVFTRSGVVWTQQGTKLVGTGAVGPASRGSSVSLSADGNTAIVGGYRDDGYAGAAWTFTRSGVVWTQQGSKLVGTGAVGPADQGSSVSLSADGNTAIVGGSFDKGGVGAAWVFTRSGEGWAQQGSKLVGTGAVGAAHQGSSVSLSADGNTVIVGGNGDNGNVGAAWVFSRSGGVWTQQGAKLVGTGAVGAAQQGWSVSLSADGNTAIVSGHQDNGGVGAAWVYTRSGDVWTQQATKLVGTGAFGAANQGISVSLSADGSTAIVGGYYDYFGAGAAWVFTRTGGVWTQQGSKLVGTGAVGGTQNRGQSVSLAADGNTAMVGGPIDNEFEGAAWVFTRSGGVWTQQGTKLVGTGAEGTADQGWSVSLAANGSTAIVGGWVDNGSTGAVWVFARSGGVWTQQGTKLVGTGAVGSANQGCSASVSADGNTAIVGGSNDSGGVGAAWVYASLAPVITQTVGTNPSCNGASITLDAGAGYLNYSWSPGGATTRTITVSPASTTTYAVTVTSACASASASHTQTVKPLVVATAGANAEICAGGLVTLAGSGGAACSWSPSTGLSDPSSCTPTASPTQTTTYSLTVTQDGCASSNIAQTTVFTLTTPGPFPSFGPTGRTFPAGGRGFSIVGGDFNGDGIPDLATANENAAQVSVLLGNGLGGYSAPVSSATGSQPVGLATGDFNGDGRLDLAVANSGSNTVRILVGSGSGTFPTYYDRTVGVYPSGVATGDLNRDGNLDVVVSNSGSASNSVMVLLGTGTGGLGAPVAYTVGSSPREVVARDFDGNGTLDVAVANSGSNTVSVLLGNGSGALGTPTSYSVGTGPRGLAPGDFNGDGRPDLVTANFTSNDVSVLLGNGAGGFAPATAVPLGSNYGMDATAADLDGDSFDDIAAISGSRVVLFRSDGLGGFTNVGSYAAGLSPNGVLAADLNSDGILDVASSNANSSSISVYLGGPAGVLRAGTRYASGSVAHGVQLGDLNGDAILDAVALNTGTPYTVSTLLGDGSGGFGAPLAFTAGDVPNDHVLADLNRDGKLDLAVANFGGHNVSVFLGTGTGSFGMPYSVSTGPSSEPRAVAVGDLNRDGALDLFVADYTGNRVVVFSGPFTTYFRSTAYYAAGTHPICVSVGDLNSDGVPDVVTANYDQERISVLLGTNGGASLAAPAGYTVTWSPLRVQIGDFNEDGALDLAVARSGTRNVAILLGNGAGAFGPATNYPIAPYARGMSSLDFDGDGHLDLVVSGDDSTLAFLRGNGDGTLGTGTYLNGWAGGSPAVGDVDRNGSPDLVCADRELFVYLNTRARPSVLRITTGPSTCNSTETPFATQPVVSILDHGWNPVTCGSVPVTASLVSGTGTPKASLLGTKTVASSSGMAAFSDLAVDVSGTAYRLRFESPGLDGVYSAPLDVGSGSLRLQGPAAVCRGTSGVFQATPGYRTYVWKLGATWLSETGPVLQLSNLPTGSYTLTATVADSCLGDLTTSFAFSVQDPVAFAGASGVAAATGDVCGLEVSWVPAGPGYTYSVYRSTTTGFVPWSGTRIASCLTGSTYVDTSAVSGTTYRYVVRAENGGSNQGGPCNGGCSDSNLVYRSGSYTCANASPKPVAFLNVTAGNGQNIVQWVNPTSGGYSTSRIVAKLGGYATGPADPGALATQEQSGRSGAADSWVHSGLANDTTVYYTAYVFSSTTSTYSPARFASGRPADNSGVANPVKWAYSTGATAMAPPGVGSVYVASNDRGLHSILAGDETVPRSGAWPPGWNQGSMNAPAQGQPPVVPTSLFSGASKVVFLGSQDGRVYAIDALTGGTLSTSPVLGDAIQAGAAGMFTRFGGEYDLLFVGTRNTSSGNRLVALRIVDNALQTAWTFDNMTPGNGSGDGEIGIISGTAAVDYANNRVYFTSRRRQNGSPRTLWCLSFTDTEARYVDAVNLSDVDGSVTLAGTDAIVGDNMGRVHSYQIVGGLFSQNWTSTVAAGDGPVKRFPWVDFSSGRIYLATTTRLWALTPDGSAFWPAGGVALPTGANPSNPLVVNGKLYSGGGGRLFEYDATAAEPGMPRSAQLGDPTAVPQPVVGSPAFDGGKGLVYIGTDTGIVYAIKVPLP